jgi:hypothetical protein
MHRVVGGDSVLAKKKGSSGFGQWWTVDWPMLHNDVVVAFDKNIVSFWEYDSYDGRGDNIFKTDK